MVKEKEKRKCFLSFLLKGNEACSLMASLWQDKISLRMLPARSEGKARPLESQDHMKANKQRESFLSSPPPPKLSSQTIHNLCSCHYLSTQSKLNHEYTNRISFPFGRVGWGEGQVGWSCGRKKEEYWHYLYSSSVKLLFWRRQYSLLIIWPGSLCSCILDISLP